MRKLIAVLALVGVLFSLSALAAVNVNSAGAEALASLSGVGPVKAKAIIDYRKKNGDFKSLDDLTQVNGIGDKTVAGLRDNATVGDSGSPDSAATDDSGASDSMAGASGGQGSGDSAGSNADSMSDSSQ